MNPRENESMTLLVLLHLAFQEIVLMLAIFMLNSIL